jgi:uncharacterized Tic20 family protein
MPFVIACPSCQAKLKANEAMVGKKARCPGCGTAVLVRSPAVTPARSAPRKKGGVEELPEAEFDEVEEIRPGRRPARGRGRDDYDDEVDDYDDEDEDRPRRKGKKGAPARSLEPDPNVREEERSSAMIIYLLMLIPMVGIIISLIMWLNKRKDSDFVDHHGKQLFNMIITEFCYGVCFGILIFASGFLFLVSWILAICLMGLFYVVLLGIMLTFFVFYIIALIKAKGGVWYTIPMTFKILK